MSNINTGGPAFPQQVQVAADVTTLFYGMTLRDYFAAKAMASKLQWGVLRTKEDRDEWLPKLADFSYEMADAMLKAREA